MTDYPNLIKLDDYNNEMTIDQKIAYIHIGLTVTVNITNKTTSEINLYMAKTYVEGVYDGQEYDADWDKTAYGSGWDPKYEPWWTSDMDGVRVDVVSSIEVTGGPNEPFERVTLKMSKKAVSAAYPALMVTQSDGSVKTGNVLRVVPGSSLIRIRLFTARTDSDTPCEYVVTSAKLSNNTYTLQGYCYGEKLRGMSLADAVPHQAVLCMQPLKWIQRIAADSDCFSKGAVVSNVNPEPEAEEDEGPNMIRFTFKDDVTAWQAMQMCAAALNAKVFMNSERVFLINYETLDVSPKTLMAYTRYRAPYFKDQSKADPAIVPVTLDDDLSDIDVNGHLSSEAEFGDEGFDNVINKVTVTFEYVVTEDNKDVTKTGEVTPFNRSSVQSFGTRSQSLSISELVNPDKTVYPDGLQKYNRATYSQMRRQAEYIGDSVVNYMCEPTESVCFTVTERMVTKAKSTMVGGTAEAAWHVSFPVVCYADMIQCIRDDSVASAISVFVDKTQSTYGNAVHPQKLYLSLYTRSYPNMTSKYWFGVTQEISLAQTTSEIMSRLR